MLDNVGLRYPHRASGAKAPALCDRCPASISLFPPLAALTFAASSIICAFGSICRTSLAVSALKLCGIAPYFTISGRGFAIWGTGKMQIERAKPLLSKKSNLASVNSKYRQTVQGVRSAMLPSADSWPALRGDHRAVVAAVFPVPADTLSRRASGHPSFTSAGADGRWPQRRPPGRWFWRWYRCGGQLLARICAMRGHIGHAAHFLTRAAGRCER